jgi:divalent metal cation (Fe/Co/Zn/Cd) transporter
LLFPQALVSLDLGVWVIGGSLIAAAALIVMQTWVVGKTGSTAIAADRAHYITDIAVNAGVLLALVVTKLIGWERADPTFAPLIAGYLATAFGASTTREHDMRSHFRRVSSGGGWSPDCQPRP